MSEVMRRPSATSLLICLATVFALLDVAPAADVSITSKQITFGPDNHFFGYIGHVQNIPWNGNGRYILAIRTSFQDRLPGPNDAADVVLIDTHDSFSVRVVDKCRGWNPQQGTMFYWNPASPDTQFLFNDRDPETGKVFCVLFDIADGTNGSRVREYRFDDTPIGNGGVAQNGGHFLGINYARMARLRPVTGYKDAWDWTTGVQHPEDDGVFKVGIATGEKSLLVSFAQIARALKAIAPGVDIGSLFINHTLWNREGDRIFFFARAGWRGGGTKVNQAFLIRPDGTQLVALKHHIGGHPEWDYGQRMIGRLGDRQIVYDTRRQLVVGALGTPDIFPKPEGDIALSPNGEWFVNGYKDKRMRKNFYTIYRREDGAHVRSAGFDIGQWTSGDLRQDPSPCWNRDSTQILVPAIDVKTKTRQLWIVDVRAERL